MRTKKMIVTGLIFILLGIIFGLLKAHYLAPFGVGQHQIESVGTASDYLFYNGLGLLVLAAIAPLFDFGLQFPYRGILWGTIFFAGSIMSFAIFPVMDVNVQFLWPVTPIGGILIIFGWLSVLIKYLSTYKR